MKQIQGPPTKGAEVMLEGYGISLQIRLDTKVDFNILKKAIEIADKRRYPRVGK